MAEIKKLTKKDNFTILKGIVEEMGRNDLVAFINRELELLDNKNNNKTQTKTQKENEGIKEIIVNALQEINGMARITDIQEKSPILKVLSSQKMSALLTQLIKEQKVERVLDKKVTYFKLI